MASATTNDEYATTTAAPARSSFGGLWQAWRTRRRRERARHMSQVRFRLTREGVHFIGILVFIFIGAVIRDINLLVLLAGAMLGLLLLQWRFNSSTLAGLSLTRQNVDHTTADQNTDFEVELRNPKPWLGAWLLLVEDPIRKILPTKRRLSEKGVALVDSIKPRATAGSRYNLMFHERGQYRVGPSTISTRFPLGLGRAWRSFDNACSLTVYPKLGTLTKQVDELLHFEQIGQAKAAAHASVHEGEFYGLRPWVTGDSRRWIHWRTTARLGELSVRQFEQQQQQQMCVLLELFQSKTPDTSEAVETAISFLATLATSAVKRGRNKLSVAVVGSETKVLTAVQSPILVNNLLESLAVANASPKPDLLAAVSGLAVPLLHHPYLVVLSTREDQSRELLGRDSKLLTGRLANRLRIRWVNVTAGELEPYFA